MPGRAVRRLEARGAEDVWDEEAKRHKEDDEESAHLAGAGIAALAASGFGFEVGGGEGGRTPGYSLAWHRAEGTVLLLPPRGRY